MHAHSTPTAPPRFDIADIFRAHGEAYRRSHTLSDQQRRAMWSIEHCRTQALGGHIYECTDCASEVPLYNSCLSRFCPTCQGPAQHRWIAQRQKRLLPTHYFHLGFTLPAQLRPLAWRHKRVVYDLLFAAAADTVIELCADPKHLGAEAGLSLVLHTWNRELKYHPHVHGIVPGGGLDSAGERWVAFNKTFFIHLKVISALFRGKFLAALKHAYARGAFADDPSLDSDKFQKLLDPLYHLHWNVFAKPPFGGPPQIVEYLGRYTHRTGISNARLRSVTDDTVAFRTKNGNTCTVSVHEFIRRFLLHVLPTGYTKIRHYGLLAPGNVNSKLVQARALIEKAQPPAPLSPLPPPPPPRAASVESNEPSRSSFDQELARPKLRCPICKASTFRRITTLPPERRRRNQPPPHT